MKFSTVVSLLLVPITSVNAENQLTHCNAFVSELQEEIEIFRGGDDDHNLANLICSHNLCSRMRSEITNSDQPKLMIPLYASCTGVRTNGGESCSTVFNGLNKNQKTEALCQGVAGCTFDAAQCQGDSTCRAAFSGKKISQRTWGRCNNARPECEFQPAPFENACIEQYADSNFYDNVQARNLLEQAFRNENNCKAEVAAELSRRRRNLQAGNTPVLDYFALLLRANDKEEEANYVLNQGDQARIGLFSNGFNLELYGKYTRVKMWYEKGWGMVSDSGPGVPGGGGGGGPQRGNSIDFGNDINEEVEQELNELEHILSEIDQVGDIHEWVASEKRNENKIVEEQGP